MCLHLPLFEPFETLSVCPRSPTFPHAAINHYAVAKSFQACLLARRLPAEANNSSLPQFQLHFPNPAHRAPIPLRVARLLDDGPELDKVEDCRVRLDFPMLVFGMVSHWHHKHRVAVIISRMT
jgi:hypothetical protein